MQTVVADVIQQRDVLLRSLEATALSGALTSLRSMGSLPAHVLRETFVGLAVESLGQDATLPEAVRASARELVRSWRRNLQRWRAKEAPKEARPRSRSPGEDRDDMDNMDRAAVPHLSGPRERVLRKFHEALKEAALRRPVPEETRETSTLILAARIEAGLHEKLGQLGGRRYTSQARSLLYNLKDETNSEFVQNVLSGRMALERLPELSAEEMASSSRAAQREKVRQEALEATSVRPAGLEVTDRFRCEKCLGTQTSYVQSTAVESCVRSGGEPVETMVTFVTCLACLHTWTERSGFA